MQRTQITGAHTGDKATRLVVWYRTTLVGAFCFFIALPQAKADTSNEFLSRIYTNAAKKTLLYRLLLPRNYDPRQSYPVILYLHGAAARGSDNTEPLNWGPQLFLQASLRENQGFFLVVP